MASDALRDKKGIGVQGQVYTITGATPCAEKLSFRTRLRTARASGDDLIPVGAQSVRLCATRHSSGFCQGSLSPLREIPCFRAHQSIAGAEPQGTLHCCLSAALTGCCWVLLRVLLSRVSLLPPAPPYYFLGLPRHAALLLGRQGLPSASAVLGGGALVAPFAFVGMQSGAACCIALRGVRYRVLLSILSPARLLVLVLAAVAGWFGPFVVCLISVLLDCAFWDSC